MPTVSVARLTSRPDVFQYREAGAAGYDEAHVQRIVGEFQLERFDPLLVVADPDRSGHYVVLGGHHRLEAARRLRLQDVPITVLQGDISSAEGRRVLVDEAIITNYGRRPTNIREDARAARALHDNGRNITEVGATLGKTATEVNKLLWFSNLPTGSQQLAVDAPDLQPAAIETGRAVETYGLSPAGADAVLRRIYQDSIASGKSPPPASQIRERWRQASVLAEAQRSTGGLPGFEASTDVLVAGWQQAGSEAAGLAADRQRLDRRLSSCAALAAELGVSIEDVQRAAASRREELTAGQEAKVREALTGYREAATGAPETPPPAAPSAMASPVVAEMTEEEREEAERRRAREAMATSGGDMFGESPVIGTAPALEQVALEQVTLGEDFATDRQTGFPMGEGRGRHAPLADREELLARQQRREAVERGQQEMPGTPAPTSWVITAPAPVPPPTRQRRRPPAVSCPAPEAEPKRSKATPVPKKAAAFDWSKDDLYGGEKPPKAKSAVPSKRGGRGRSEYPSGGRKKSRR